MPYFHDLVVGGRPLRGGGKMLAELVTAALAAGLDVPDGARLAKPIDPAHIAWFRATAQQLERTELARFLAAASGAPVEFVVRAPTLGAWLADAVDYYRELGFFARIEPDGDAVAARWPGDPDVAFSGGDLLDAVLLAGDQDLVIDGYILPRPLAPACAFLIERIAELGRRTARRARRFGELGRGLYELDIVDVVASEDAAEIAYTVDGRSHVTRGYADNKYALQLDPMLRDVNRAIAATGRQLYMMRSPQIVVLLAPDVAERLQRERGVTCHEPAPR